MFTKTGFKGDVLPLLWKYLFEGLSNISANRFEIDSEILKKFDGISKGRSFDLAMETSF